jgi:hypothetical protein
VKQLYEERGWLPAPNLDALDEPEHAQRRKLFDEVFKPVKIKKLDPIVHERRPSASSTRSSTTVVANGSRSSRSRCR